ncbi:hypothetical protein AVEN_97062-1 [Araneus ventricosus]|uniref:Uncharacterized protein n=1 Tax=Araneus ventricosus TaxID=182803 RepID=A0A4Y2JIE2_ARAVE|nr:hypothetical protein AVEN_97062-1 [Araneus ventricosus]
MTQTARIDGPLLPNDNSSCWWWWNYGVGNVFFEYTGSLYIYGHNSEQHSLLQRWCRPRALVYGCNVPLWRWSLSAGHCTLTPCSIDHKLVEEHVRV